MADGRNIQDAFLNAVIEKNASVAVYLVSGIKLQGNIVGYDEHVVLMTNSTSQIIYKHAISTIVPSQAISLVEVVSPESG